MAKKLKFYANANDGSGRKLFTFYVNGITDARNLLKKMNVPAGYYVETKSGQELKNFKIKA